MRAALFIAVVLLSGCQEDVASAPLPPSPPPIRFDTSELTQTADRGVVVTFPNGRRFRGYTGTSGDYWWWSYPDGHLVTDDEYERELAAAIVRWKWGKP